MYLVIAPAASSTGSSNANRTPATPSPERREQYLRHQDTAKPRVAGVHRPVAARPFRPIFALSGLGLINSVLLFPVRDARPTEECDAARASLSRYGTPCLRC